jgi:hypothetical protein
MCDGVVSPGTRSASQLQPGRSGTDVPDIMLVGQRCAFARPTVKDHHDALGDARDPQRARRRAMDHRSAESPSAPCASPHPRVNRGQTRDRPLLSAHRSLQLFFNALPNSEMSFVVSAVSFLRVCRSNCSLRMSSMPCRTMGKACRHSRSERVCTPTLMMP